MEKVRSTHGLQQDQLEGWEEVDQGTGGRRTLQAEHLRVQRRGGGAGAGQEDVGQPCQMVEAPEHG